jgi:hypothetical protein
MIYSYLCGAASALAAVAGVFFVRYWRESRDRFFALWAIAFALMAAQWGLSALAVDAELVGQVYLLRLAGFLLIAGAIIDKNRGGAGKRRKRARSSARASHLADLEVAHQLGDHPA